MSKADEIKEKGNAAYKSGNYSAAIDYYTKAIELSPMATLFNNRAAAHLMSEHFDQAIEDCTVAIKLDPELAKAYVRAGTAHTALGQVDQAREMFRAALGKDAGNEAARAGEAKVMKAEMSRKDALKAFDQGNFIEAAQRAREAADIFYGSADTKLLLARALVEVGGFDEATTITGKLIMHGGDAEVQFLRSRAMYGQGKFGQAAQMMANVVKLDPDNSRYVALLKNARKMDAAKSEANEHYKEKRYEDAVNGYTAALEIDPTSAVLLCNRAAAYNNLENHAAAVEDATQALDLAPFFTRAFARRVAALQAMGRLEEAAADLERWTAIEPASEDAKRLRSQVTRAIKKARGEPTYEGVTKVNSVAEFQAAMTEPGLVVVDYFAEWCGPCKRIAPLVEELAKQNPHVIFLKVDVDGLPELAQRAGVSSMPTFALYKGGQQVERFSGADPGRLSTLVAQYA